ncbi:ligand-binding sensor domain-containing protein [Flavilitoribacter nigricans]|uniref:Regulator n=1 Tax=Flavilitoribacter nigricans (strain ATCC 23147 / DSM 23189 / NBRC 102662 / NCIMB 1420 / SS-2) TaxID=1122177 RepID=A0A2D0N3B2_FLAN2|nr:regulator [Flavilitoribacter nigricans]PHN02994.1 regulator [Flavilitoribacter nigricans DSM 23189 = NBRC 102662]
MRVPLFTLLCALIAISFRLAGQTAGYTDVPFFQESHDGYLVDSMNRAANDVRSVLPDPAGEVWIATKNGVYRKPKEHRHWDLMIQGNDQGPAYDLSRGSDGTFWIAAWNGIYAYRNGKMIKAVGPTGPVAQISATGSMVYALGPLGVWQLQEDRWQQLELDIARSIRKVLPVKENELWIGTDVGLYYCLNNACVLYQDTSELLSAYVQGMDYDPMGNLWVGGLGGITIRNEQGKIAVKRPQDGLPNAQVTVVRRAPDGSMWVGTDHGISRFPAAGETYSVLLNKRWLMADEVRDIAFDPEGNAWIATSGGVSCIKKEAYTLSRKADYFYDRMLRRNLREPWIIGRFRLTTAGDTTSIVPDDDDNDGEYNAMYLAMESFRYATTGAPSARERAQKSFDFLYKLREITGTDGFFARTIIPAEWQQMHDPNREYTPQELADELIKNPRHKPVRQRWHLTEDGRQKWKGDTSSDELCGHLFGYYCYYHLAADNRERARINRHVSQITDHLIRNDFNLVDVDGKPTKWGVWSPQSLNEDPDWAPEKALNSLEILSWLKFAAYISENEAYERAYRRLIEEEGYLENAMGILQPNPAFETYFDIFLALYIFPPLIEYETDPARSARYRALLDGWFARNRSIKSPLVNFTYNWLAGGADELDSSIAFLKDMPLDLVDWQMDNSRREDLQLVREPILEEIQVNALRPPGEYRSIRWDKNPYLAVAGNPHQEREPVFWLLPYWMGRYLGLIAN